MHYSLYILKHPETNKTVYVGVTTKTAYRRNNHKCIYKNKYGFVPVMDVLMTFSNEVVAWKMEEAMIDDLRRQGEKLNNCETYLHGKKPLDGRGYEKRAAELRNSLNDEFIEMAKSFGINAA